MKTIWKFETPFEGRFLLDMPLGAEILTVQRDQKTMKPCIWALVDKDQRVDTRTFELFGTGHEIHVDMGIERKYIGTYQIDNGSFVGHLFERLGI